jgi:hypothetical protein
LEYPASVLSNCRAICGAIISLTSNTNSRFLGQLRREVYRRPSSSIGLPSLHKLTAVLTYNARHCQTANPVRENILGLLNLILSWCSQFSTTDNLGNLLSGSQEIVGFLQKYDSALLSDLLDLDFNLGWGSLVNLCSNLRFENRYQLMFLIAPMAFSHTGPDEMKLMRTLIGFSILGDLKVIIQPKWQSYSNFQYRVMPTVGGLFELIEPHL